MSSSKVAVIIPVFNDTKRLKLCLTALSQQTYPTELFDVLVVDNNSSEDIKSVVQEFPFAQYLFEAKPGSYAARNRALENIDADFIAFTDSDCIPQPNWLEASIHCLHSASETVGAVGGKVVLFAENERPNLCEYYDMVTGFNQQSYILKDRFSVTANLIIRRIALEKTGPFNDQLMSSGDKDWCLRMQQSDFELAYCEKSQVAHPARHSIKQIKTKLRRLFGGFYHNHKHVKKDRLFQPLGLLEAAMPPMKNIRQMQQADIKLSAITKVKLIGFFYYLKLYTLFFRLGLIFGLINTTERL
ncbi:glycosyltransferase family A protein [Aliiglaciecola litoralis]|uniref:Glycosyltransferase n=1 Tax=Aliiglaciecola litoralis TaxID=582857 RepID=A0ABP3WYK0_9ALTE